VGSGVSVDVGLGVVVKVGSGVGLGVIFISELVKGSATVGVVGSRPTGDGS